MNRYTKCDICGGPLRRVNTHGFCGYCVMNYRPPSKRPRLTEAQKDERAKAREWQRRQRELAWSRSARMTGAFVWRGKVRFGD